ncbi:homocysteine S-methyltransferase family protein [Guyparkeria halophila]|uniref:Homocysteine S-methyltransferase family protein n=1 Tax=Guyparkeria halophila TaxID=47960 RepID=A0ABZ0YYI6_9GAMM|nr:homocysteine S-methyltransferase family protein [Guyparkeria halophila]WQH17248.1 homocysteine S-methyltransferase family protein [Guyparkeria halophila]
MTYTALRKGEVRLLDGATGTELEKRGVPMSSGAWSGPAALDHADVLEQIHRDYIDAGADIITANTYATSRALLEMDGLGDQFETINRSAVHAAQRARDKSNRPDVLVDGSLSHRGPIATGSARPNSGAAIGLEKMARALREQARLLRDEGCDLLLLEMLYDPERMPLVFAAAAESGLPVWAGFSARRGDKGEVLGFGPGADVPFAEIVSILDDWPVDAAGIMHTPANVVSDALTILRPSFAGPLMAYPDSGYFKSPHWQFEDVIEPHELRRYAEEWVEDGAQILGGCCGLSPEHIAALAPLKRGPSPENG